MFKVNYVAERRSRTTFSDVVK